MIKKTGRAGWRHEMRARREWVGPFGKSDRQKHFLVYLYFDQRYTVVRGATEEAIFPDNNRRRLGSGPCVCVCVYVMRLCNLGGLQGCIA